MYFHIILHKKRSKVAFSLQIFLKIYTRMMSKIIRVSSFHCHILLGGINFDQMSNTMKIWSSRLLQGH